MKPKKNILLLRRKADAGQRIWSIPGGRLICGESECAGLIREVREETGLTVKMCSLLGHIDLIVDGQKWCSAVFRVDDVEGSNNIGLDEPFDLAEWFGLDDLPQLDYVAQTTIDNFRRELELAST